MNATRPEPVEVTKDPRLDQLIAALEAIVGKPLNHPALTLGDIGLDSAHLVALMLATDDIYLAEVPFEDLDISIDTSIANLHEQIVALKLDVGV